MADHPYRGIPDHQYWSRAVTWAPPGALDPVVAPRFGVDLDDRIATMGSCFAQHLSRHLSRSGLDYFVAEQAPAGFSADEAAAHQYGTYSARYGNVYTVAQGVQLLRRAYGDFAPAEQPWLRADGALADPFRPLVEPRGFADAGALDADRAVHLAAVRRVIEESSTLVFTLGLTEAWRSRADGAVFATAPGVNGGSYDPERYEFVNFDVDAVRRDLVEFCELVRSANPTIKVLLTVSPVPLIATFEPRHVLVSTALSKAVLRVAADEAIRRFDFVDYFPSYEIISTASSTRNYYEPDLREVTDAGVAHVMRVFTHHYVDGRPWTTGGAGAGPVAAVAGSEDGEAAIVCDEETVAAAIEASTTPRQG